MIKTGMTESQCPHKDPIDEDYEDEFNELRRNPIFTERKVTRLGLPVTRERTSIKSLIRFMKSVVGKDLTKVTMPVHFNEPLSFLQRLAEDLEYADILNRACVSKNSLVRIAHVGAFACSTYSTVLSRFWKPFNPLLGETFEFINSDLGYALIAEQVSHHPPISALHAESDHWVFWQEYSLDTKFRGQFFKVIPTGTCHLKFKTNGHHFSWKKPITTIHNILVGSLYVDQEGDVLVTNHQTKETCTMHFMPVRKVQDKFKVLKGEVKDAEGNIRYVIDGHWDRSLECRQVDGDLNTADPIDLWSVNRRPDDSYKMYAFTNFGIQLNDPDYGQSCPTDCRNRPDIRHLEDGKIDDSAKEKHRLEEKQRAARRDRETSQDAWTPRWFVPREDPYTRTFVYVYKGGYWQSRCRGHFDGIPGIY
ncbi:oxysterol-binding protein 1 [Exaiptasia diaphana]|uniref:Oxysterol-binding protein n=1 Tax=Exaiptasia diaphana TaxID=2652724 RepID=A0A913X0Z0_EXADI|nr:oxysterol-binding protein 1 [Exaiptasia diaphana]KXJ16295.1 Oxysterol-binding protein 2 [Exaiptasia diaphana]